jgi:hypothetical protein
VSQPGDIVGVAVPFVWLGMVLAISVLETPLKFRAPGITLALGLGIGRRVFRALNLVEVALAAVLTALCAAALQPPAAAWGLLVVAWVLLAVQVILLRPALDRRALRIIAGDDVAPSRQHLAYIGLEGAKVLVLCGLGASLVSAALL